MISAFVLFLACGGDPVLEGDVTDIWGAEVAEATVMMVGYGQAQTDANGRYRLARVSGEQELKVGHQDYIQATESYTVSEDRSQGGPSFQLYKKTDDKGFFLVGSEEYEALAPEKVLAKGNQLKAIYGVQSVGKASSRASKFEVIFRTDLKLDEIHRLGLSLHRLSYMKEMALPGPLGQETMADALLYVVDGEVDFSIAQMGSKEHFLITTEEPLKPGEYVLQTQELLTPQSAETFHTIPENLRVVFPLTITE